MGAELVLGLDTSTSWMNLALLDGAGSLLGERRARQATHTTTLSPAVAELLSASGATPGDLAAAGAVVGPGSFTGLRVGLATVLGLCAGRGIPVWGIGSLEALAHFAPAPGVGIALLDARRGRVYAARFRSGGGAPVRLGEDLDLPPGQVLAGGGEPAWGVGDGVALVPGWPEGCPRLPEVPNLALPAARRALAALGAGTPREALLARYVRPADAVPPAR